MPRTCSNRKLAKRLDTIIGLPLARFRAAIGRLTLDDLEALQARIELLTVKQRWALGGHGLERHRAPNALGLLERRLEATRHEVRARDRVSSTQLRLIELDEVRERSAPIPVDEAA